LTIDPNDNPSIETIPQHGWSIAKVEDSAADWHRSNWQRRCSLCALNACQYELRTVYRIALEPATYRHVRRARSLGARFLFA